MLEQIKKLVRVAKGRDFFCATTLTVQKKKYGTEYGGWWIYPELLDKDAVVLSIGLGEDVSFDLALVEAFGCSVYGFDPTPKSINYLNSLQLPKGFHLHPFALSDANGKLTFHLPENDDYVSGSLESIGSQKSITVECKTMTTILEEIGVNRIDLLKMDIEGSEYKVIEDMMSSDIYPRQILIEYHHFFDNITSRDTKNSIELLRRHGYELFCIEGYNYSFIHRSIVA